MPHRTLIFAPESWMSAEVCEALPGVQSALAELRKSLDVVTFRWPCTVGAPSAGSGWQGVVDALAAAIEREAVASGRPVSVLAMQDASGLAVAAIAAKVDLVERFIPVSIDLTASMLRRMGMTTLVDFFKSTSRTREIAEQGSHARRFLGYGMDGATDDELPQAAALVDATIDWECWDAFFHSYDEEFDVGAVSSMPVVPTLFLDVQSSVQAGGEKRSTF